MKRNIREILAGSFPSDMPHWIVEFHTEFDNPELTPLEAVKMATKEIMQGHGWLVIHMRSGLKWSVNLGREEVVEIEEKKS